MRPLRTFHVTYTETTTRTRVVELDAKDEGDARAMIERVPEMYRAPRFYRDVREGSATVEDVVTKIEEKKT
jgi:hypothetical protein